MKKLCEDKGCCTLSDLYSMLNINTAIDDYIYGWRHIPEELSIRNAAHGTIYLALPMPEKLV